MFENKYVQMALVATIAIAVVFRVSPLKKLVAGE